MHGRVTNSAACCGTTTSTGFSEDANLRCTPNLMFPASVSGIRRELTPLSQIA